MDTGRCYIYILFIWGCLTILPLPSLSKMTPERRDAFGIPGHPVRLQCGAAIVKELREELVWRRSRTDPTPLLARGVYVDGSLTNPSYYKRLAGGRAELSSDGSLTIHSYEDEDKGLYRCESQYRQVWTELYTFSRVFGLPGRPVRLECKAAMVKGVEELEWRKELEWAEDFKFERHVAQGVYFDGNLTKEFYHNELANGRAQLSSGGSLTIHSYEDMDAGLYLCYGKYLSDNTARYHLTTSDNSAAHPSVTVIGVVMLVVMFF